MKKRKGRRRFEPTPNYLPVERSTIDPLYLIKSRKLEIHKAKFLSYFFFQLCGWRFVINLWITLVCRANSSHIEEFIKIKKTCTLYFLGEIFTFCLSDWISSVAMFMSVCHGREWTSSNSLISFPFCTRLPNIRD